MKKDVDYTPWLGDVETWPRDLFGTPVPPPGTVYEAGYNLRLALLRLFVIAAYKPFLRPLTRWMARK